MKGKSSTLLTGLLLLLLLVGCGKAAQEETPVTPAASPTPLPTVSALESAPEPTVPPPPAQPPSVYLEPAVVNLTVGGTATVNVWIDGAYRLNRLVLTMHFNPNYVQVEDADPTREGVQVAPGTIPMPVNVIRNEVTVGEGVGKIVYEVALDAGTEVEGSGVTAVITLRGVAEGGTPLQFESVAVYDGDGNPVEVAALSDGLITVQAAEEGEQASAPEASPQPTAPPAPTPTPQAMSPTPGPTVSPAPTSPAVSEMGIYYVVQSGENLFRIGLKFGTTAEAIASASNITDPGQVQAGAMVLVPVPPPRGRYGYYVQPRDTVYSIARRFGLTVDELVALNGIGPDYRIEVGQILIVVP